MKVVFFHFEKYNSVKKVFTIFIARCLNQAHRSYSQATFVLLGVFFLVGCSVPDYLNPVKGYETIEDTVTGWFTDDEEIQETEQQKRASEDQEIPENLGSDQENRLYEDEVARDLEESRPVTNLEKTLDLKSDTDLEVVQELDNDFYPIEKQDEYKAPEKRKETPDQAIPKQQVVLNKSNTANLLDDLDLEAFGSFYELAGSALVGSIYYDIGSSTISSRGESILKKTNNFYKKYGGKVRVIGYASPNPGSEKDAKSKLNNFKIASERAMVVARALIGVGIDIKDLIIDSKSDIISSVRRSSRFHFAKDRRVDIFLTKRE